jgi:purine-cytosine permease-like protein
VAKESSIAVEANGLNVIPEGERHGKASGQFWPWAAANISLFGISMAGWIFSFGLNFTQLIFASIFGIVFSFAMVGIISLAGRRGSAPTMVLSRAAFGIHGNALPAGVSYLLLVGWETALVSLGVLASDTVMRQLGFVLGDNNFFGKVLAFVVIAGLTIFSGIWGFKLIMKIQKWITLSGILLTVVFIALTLPGLNPSSVDALTAGSTTTLVATMVYAATAFGLGWVNSGADYSRYLPRKTKGLAIFGWTTFGAAIGPIVLMIYGFLLVSSNADIAEQIGGDPIGALLLALPEGSEWFLLPFLLVVVIGFLGGAILDIYSSGLALLTMGVKISRPVAAGIDGLLMVLGTFFFVFVADSFFWPFQAGLYILGTPIAAWTGVFIADLVLRKRDYNDNALYSAKGRYGSINFSGFLTMIVGTVVGFGLIVSPDVSLTWTTWEGYIFRALGFTADNPGDWYFSNIGVFVALAIGFVGHFVFGRNAVKRQES